MTIYVFLSGGFDGLNLLCPYAGEVRAAYEFKKSTNQIPIKYLTQLKDLKGNNNWSLYKEFSILKPLWEQKNLAIVHACGKADKSKSHNQARSSVKRGFMNDECTGQSRIADTGWLTRYLTEMNGLENLMLPAVSIGHYVDESLLGFNRSMSVSNAVGINRDFIRIVILKLIFKNCGKQCTTVIVN